MESVNTLFDMIGNDQIDQSFITSVCVCVVSGFGMDGYATHVSRYDFMCKVKL